jgi:hypothetical protein
MDGERLLRQAYESFNAKDVEALLAVMTDDVDWPNMLEGSRLVGHDAVREYWRGQFRTTDPRLEITGVDEEGDATVLSVHQSICDLEGTVLREADVEHVYRFREGKVARMDVRMPA